MCVWTQVPPEHHITIGGPGQNSIFKHHIHSLDSHGAYRKLQCQGFFFTRGAVRLCLVLNVSFRFWLRT